MKWKNRLTNYNFWISIVSAVLLILQNLNIQFDIANFNELVTAVLGLLVVIGIINDPTKSATASTQKDCTGNSSQSSTEKTDKMFEDKLENNSSTNKKEVDEMANIITIKDAVGKNEDVNKEETITKNMATPIDEENENNANITSPVDEISIIENIVNQIQVLETDCEVLTEKIKEDEIANEIQTDKIQIKQSLEEQQNKAILDEVELEQVAEKEEQNAENYSLGNNATENEVNFSSNKESNPLINTENKNT